MIPWWKSRTIQWSLVTLALWAMVFVAMLFGIDVDTLITKAVAAAGTASTLLTIVGRVTSPGVSIDPAKVFPGVSSPGVESIIGAIKDSRNARDERIIE
jgi:hypothetical protein